MIPRDEFHSTLEYRTIPRRSIRVWRLIASLSFLLCSTLGLAQSGQHDALENLSDAVSAVAAKVAPAVVKIVNACYVSEREDETDAGYTKLEVTGSGVILTSDGFIVTNAHVIKGAKRIRVFFNPSNLSSRSAVLEDNAPIMVASLIGADEDTDLALLKVEGSNLPTVPFADPSTVRQGNVVLAIGNPMGLKNSVSLGIISSVARQEDDDRALILLQTDAAINSGNSGGALVDTQGRLVGITTEMMDGQRLGFAIPSDVVESVVAQIRSLGHVNRGEIGVEVQQLTPMIAKGLGLHRTSGVLIAGIKPSSPADKSGLKPSDIISSVDGKPVTSVPEFQSLVYFRAPGETLSLEVLRNNQKTSFRVPVISKTVSTPLFQSDPDKNLVRKLGVFVAEVTPESIGELPNLRERSGVLVKGKMSEVHISGCDLKPGDIIHSLNGNTISKVEDLRTALEKIPSGAVVLLVERNSRYIYLGFEVDTN